MSISWKYFVSKRVHKSDVSAWLKKSCIYSLEELKVILKRMKIRPPEEGDLKSVVWPILQDKKAKKNSKEDEISLGQKSLTSSLKKPSTRRKKTVSSANSTTTRRRKKSEKEK